MPTPPPQPTTITDSKFNALKTKLRELFELDKSDLDFGIYRIIAAKNKEVTEFLDRQLKDVVRSTLAAHGAGAADQVQAELNKAIEQARALGADPETLPKVKDLRARLEAGGGADAVGALEADIYNHLLAFFGRYYDEGDFISQRRYKGDTYAIPYSGEEVTLHWANKDQYYIKSGEWHKDYRFRVGPDLRDGHGKTVRFKLIEATQEVGNNKESDDAKRRYILAAENPVEESASELTLRFEFRAPKPADIERAGPPGGPAAVAIFGGDYAKPSNPKKGDEREQFCADAEKRALVAMSAAWKGVATAASPTESKPARTILGKHLDHFTARNTFDYFIHKDLGGFLRRELDFYIKNEVVRLDDLESLPPDHLQRVQGKIKAIRAVASRLIAFLASLEDFQKKMWLKKKFVLNTNWLVTVDRIPPALRDVVATNAEQWAEWERLGFKPENAKRADAGLFGGAAWGTRAYLEACDKLVVDTQLYDGQFRTHMLASVELLAGMSVIDDAIIGIMSQADCAHGLRLLEPVFKGRAQFAYCDPPYNTGSDGFPYKDQLLHSSWMSMISERLRLVHRWLTRAGVCFASIDESEVRRLHEVLASVFGEQNYLTDLIWQGSSKNDQQYFSISHEYVLVALRDREFLDSNKTRWLERKDGLDDIYAAFDKIQVDHPGNFDAQSNALKEWYAGLKSSHPAKSQSHYNRVEARGIYFPDNISKPAKGYYYDVLHPETGLPCAKPKGGWRFIEPTMQAEIAAGNIHFGDDHTKVPCRKSFLRDTEYMSPRTVIYKDGRAATGVIADLFGSREAFANPKDHSVLARLMRLTASEQRCVLIDPFAGSGTTGQSAIELLRMQGTVRPFVLFEMGKQFTTVLKPRIAKTIYSDEWADGRPQKHGIGPSALIKYFALESYDDALNNLPAPSGQLLDDRTEAEKDALITYALDLELGPRLLDLDAFRDPWGYTINAQLAGDAEIKRHRVDLVETFNYLIGLKVHAYGPLERYSADFERAAHADNLGRIKITGRLRRDPNGPFVFQRVEGELNDGNATRVLVVWRKLTDDPEKDAAVLDAWMARHRETTRERTEHRDYHLIYINGPVTLPQPTAEIRTVFPTEETFKIKMFEDTDGTGGA